MLVVRRYKALVHKLSRLGSPHKPTEYTHNNLGMNRYVDPGETNRASAPNNHISKGLWPYVGTWPSIQNIHV